MTAQEITCLFVICFGGVFGYVSCVRWSYGEVMSISSENLNESTVLQQVDSRSFLDCCSKCEVAQVSEVTLLM